MALVNGAHVSISDTRSLRATLAPRSTSTRNGRAFAVQRAIVRELAERERKTGESAASAARRVRDALPRLAVLEQHVWPSVNTWHGVTIGEA